MNQTFTQPDKYQSLLASKVEAFIGSLSGLNASDTPALQSAIDELQVFDSPVEYYRQRAEFKVWHEGEHSHYAMTDRETKKPVFVKQFPVASKAINELMPKLMAAIEPNEVLRRKLFQLEFLATQSGDMLATMIYHKPLAEDWVDAANELKHNLGIKIIGRSRKQKILLDHDHVTETLRVKDKAYHYKQIEGGFTQPNAAVCEKMLTWAVDQVEGIGGDLLELYCGNGNFTLPLADRFERVVATEISKTSVQAALENMATNKVLNAQVFRLSSEEFVQAMDKQREFRRLANVDLDDYNFSTVFVDPPRAGLDTDTVKMVQRFDHILYISCNPDTLKDNLGELLQTHRLRSVAAFDQFPYTHHLETGVLLERIKYAT